MVWGTVEAGSKRLRSLAKKQINGAVVAVLLVGFFGGGLYMGNEGEQILTSAPPPVILMGNSTVNITTFEEWLRNLLHDIKNDNQQRNCFFPFTLLWELPSVCAPSRPCCVAIGPAPFPMCY